MRANVGRPDGAGGVAYASHVIMVYGEGYYLTGAQVQVQGGAQALVAAPAPAPEQGDRSTLGAAALLRAGLEARFLNGALSLAEVRQRFEAGSAAPLDQRWGLTHTYDVTAQINFRHLDDMLLTTAVTLTKAALDRAYPSRGVTPTLVIASEQRTATLNLDELPRDGEFGAGRELRFNLCGVPLLTSRSLRLATYAWDPNGDNGAALARLREALDPADGGGALVSLAPDALGTWAPLSYEQVMR